MRERASGELEQQAAIGKYTSLNVNQAAIRHISKQLGVELKVTSMSTRAVAHAYEIKNTKIYSKAH